MSWYSHFQFKIYWRRNLTLSLWCSTLTSFKPHPLHPFPSHAGPTYEGSNKTGQRLLSSNSRSPSGGLPPAGPISRPPWHPKPGSFLHSLNLFRPGEKLPAPLGPQLSGSWDLQTLLWTAGVGGPNHQPLDSKQIWGGGVPSLQGSTEHFTVDFILTSFFLRLKNSGDAM